MNEFSMTSSPTPSLGLVDYGAGNLHSVHNALRSFGVEPRLVRGPSDLDGLGRLILPGVGSFGDCVANLRMQRLWDPLRAWVAEDRPYFGICLGYQILFDTSEESPGLQGLGRFRGTVKRFAARPGLKVPHMGWNTVRVARPGLRLWDGLPEDPYFYFVHSFHPVPADDSIVAGWTDYEVPFASAVEAGTIQGVQFHPERSQENGLRLLRGFAIPAANDRSHS